MSAIESITERASRSSNASGARAPGALLLWLAACQRSLVGCLDWIERLLVLAFYLWLVARLLGNYGSDGGLANLLMLPSEGLVVLFLILRRRARTISRHPGEWMLAIVGTCSPMLVRPESMHALVPPLIGAILVLMGIVIQVLAKIALGRSLGLVPAHRGLKLNGPYRFVRHPMYAGYALSHVGFLLMNATLWNLVLYVGCESIQVLRLLAEEHLLSNDPCYRSYQATVRYRLIPGLF
jgi:protein-S-isoprenylcysteine O-methyltransferase Ste14